MSEWDWNNRVEFSELPERVQKNLIMSFYLGSRSYDKIPQEEKDRIVALYYSQLTAFEAIDKFLQYEGIIGYTGTITTLICGVMKVTKPTKSTKPTRR